VAVIPMRERAHRPQALLLLDLGHAALSAPGRI
jgi:hypothetical protein